MAAAAKPLSEEAIALTEKKMDMSLDDIIKMSKSDVGKKQQRVPNKSRGNRYVNQDRSFKVRQFMDSRSTLRQGALAQKRSSFQGKSFPFAADAAQKAANATFTFYKRPFNHWNAGNWNKTSCLYNKWDNWPGGPLRRQGNAFNGGNPPKQQQRQNHRQNRPQHQHQDGLPRGEMTHNQKPKTLDSLFANMKEQRMKTFNRPNNGGNARVGFAFNQPRQPWLRARFGGYKN